jgi:hypothetical protein
MSPVPWNCGATARRACRGPSVFGPPQLRLVAPLQPVAEGDRVPVVDQPAPAAVAVGHVRAEPAAQPPAVVEDLDLSWRVDVLRAVHARPYDVSRRKAPDSRTDRPLPCEPEIVTSQGDRSGDERGHGTANGSCDRETPASLAAADAGRHRRLYAGSRAWARSARAGTPRRLLRPQLSGPAQQSRPSRCRESRPLPRQPLSRPSTSRVPRTSR